MRANKTKMVARNTRRDRLFIVSMLAPGVLLVALFFYYPFLSGIPNAFRRYSLLNLSRTKWIGFKNFQTLFSESEFLMTIPNTIKWVLFSLVFQFLNVLCRRPGGLLCVHASVPLLSFIIRWEHPSIVLISLSVRPSLIAWSTRSRRVGFALSNFRMQPHEQ